MPQVKGKEELCRIDLGKRQFKAIGQQLFDRYELAESNTINRYVDAKYRNFLAEPAKNGDRISFYGKILNNSKDQPPRLLSKLQGDDLTKYKKIKEDTVAHYKSVISTLKNSGEIDKANFLDGAIKYINDSFVCCYDGIVVLSVWGMQLRDKTVDVTEFFTGLMRTQKMPLPPPPPVEPVVLSIAESPVETPENTEPLPLPPPEPEPVITTEEDTTHSQSSTTESDGLIAKEPKDKTRRPWWKWLLWLLLLLLLLSLLCRGGCGINPPWSCTPRGGKSAGSSGGSPWGGIRDSLSRVNPPNNPRSVPAPPGYERVLPPELNRPPRIDNPEIIREPGKPAIIANVLNIMMVNQDKTLLEFIDDFIIEYPDRVKYEIIAADTLIRIMVITTPSNEREKLKEEIPAKFAPKYILEAFDLEVFTTAAYTPNDPAFRNQRKSWYLHTVNAPKAWSTTLGEPEIIVAIVDSDFSLEHPELRDKVVMPHNVHTNSANFFRLRKKGDHGTHVAGTALAIANNRKGLLGIAPNSAFMPVQVADANGLMNSYAVFCGVLYAVYMGADVVNVSLGPDLSGMTGLPEEQQRELIRGTYKGSELLWRRVAEIADKRNAVIVKAAGNHNVLAGLDVITRPENIIVVSALDKKNQLLKAEFSNYGEYSTISAPGVDIYSAYGRNSYKTMGGTSMASPIVTGAVALMKSLNRSLTAKQIICILQSTGLQTQSNVGKLIQIDKALEAVKSDDTVFCKPPVPSTGDVQILLKWNNYNDLDLICIDPFGDTVYFKNDKVPSGGQLEIDMNREYPYSKTPIEHIFWPTGKAPHGTYKVYLLYYKKHERDIDETPFKVSVKYGDTIEEYNGIIKESDKIIHICDFTLGTTVDNKRPSPDVRPSPDAQPSPDTRPSPDTQPPNTKRNDDLLRERELLQRSLDEMQRELERLRRRMDEINREIASR